MRIFGLDIFWVFGVVFGVLVLVVGVWGEIVVVDRPLREPIVMYVQASRVFQALRSNQILNLLKTLNRNNSSRANQIINYGLLSTTVPPIIPANTSYDFIEAQQSFKNLENKEALYAYYFSKASWAGGKICFFQNSYESPPFLYIVLKAFQFCNVSEVTSKIPQGVFRKDDVEKILTYAAAFVQNAGNFKSFGDSKFIPQVPQQTFVKFWKQTPYWSRHTQEFDQIWALISKFVYEYRTPYSVLQFSDKNGTTGYYSKNCTSEDAEKVKKVLVSKGIMSENNRLVKVSDKEFVVKVPSIDIIPDRVIQGDGLKLTLKYGQFRPFLEKMNKYLAEAKKYARNQLQEKMIDLYINHFRSGNMEQYKESQKLWVKDKQPVIESNIGFIQTYQDPANIRAEYQGFVAIVNKKQSALLGKLVDAAPTLLKYLPWGKDFEVQQFIKPDFTSLQVIAFASSDIPAGINLPNYDDIREKIGFKNVNLGNNYGTPKEKNIRFTPKQLISGIIKWSKQYTFVKVALHQLLGHGSGRLLREKPQFPNPLTNSPITTFYSQNQTWRSIFGSISSLYQQCRADSVALYMSLFPQVLDYLLPDNTPQERQQIVYLQWYSNIGNGIRALEFYDVESGKWKQAHMGGRFAILNVLRRKGGIVEIVEVEKDGMPNLEIRVDREAYKTKGKQAMADFLKHLQIYKSTADIKSGTQYITQFLNVTDQYLKYKKIVDATKLPRRILVQPHLYLQNGKPKYQVFNASAEGCIDSFVRNYGEDGDQVIRQWVLENQGFRY